MKLCSAAASLILLAIATPASAQVYLTAITTWGAAADGTYNTGSWWNSIQADGGSWNVYLFTGSVMDPVFHNALTDPNYELTVGSHALGLAMNYAPTPGETHLGVNLLFDDYNANTQISAFVPVGSGSVAAVANTVVTNFPWSLDNHGSGTLVYNSGSYQVEVTSLTATFGDDIVGSQTTGADGWGDYVMTMNVNVTAVPEPATWSALGGLAALLFVLRGRRRA